MILKILKFHLPKGSYNFENFQTHLYLLITNCTWGRAISYTNSRGLSKDLQRQKGIHTYTIHKIDFLTRMPYVLEHIWWACYCSSPGHLYAYRNYRAVSYYEWLGKVVLWCSIFLSRTVNMNPKTNLWYWNNLYLIIKCLLYVWNACNLLAVMGCLKKGGGGWERKPFDQRKKIPSFHVYYTTVKNRNYWPEPNIKLQVVKPLLMQDNLPEPWYSFQRLCQISLSWGSCFIRGMLAGSSSPFMFPKNMVKNTKPSFLKIKNDKHVRY